MTIFGKEYRVTEFGQRFLMLSLDTKKEQPKSEWSAADAGTYAKNCVIDGMEAGSDRWCEKLSEKPKGEWTADEAASYAKHCVL